MESRKSKCSNKFEFFPNNRHNRAYIHNLEDPNLIKNLVPITEQITIPILI